jgi:hypothetical protein
LEVQLPDLGCEVEDLAGRCDVDGASGGILARSVSGGGITQGTKEIEVRNL